MYSIEWSVGAERWSIGVECSHIFGVANTGHSFAPRHKR